MRFIELLSPAKNLECGVAAIDHGADAVYIGPSRFGARAAAGNSAEDIANLCDYAHRYGAKVYATLNTLLREDEKEEARLLAWELYRAGTDALIVQDMALLNMDLPPIPLHASTQMDNQTAEKVAQLRSLGFNQIVLARELSLEQIRSIHEAVPEACLEVFVHGALCVSLSGRCYASEYCFGRSANRGECAQFCRLPFSLQTVGGRTLVKDKYLLSLKDMNRLAHLEALMNAGVGSFKIEGRLKDLAYVKNVTAAYRQALDSIMKRRPEFVRSSFGDSGFTFQPDLSRSFSRGYTDYFLFGRRGNMASPDTPKSRGREVGRVKEVRGGCIVVSTTETFSNGDGLCFLDAEGRLQGFRVNRVAYPHPLPKGGGNASLSLQGEVWRRLRKGDTLWRSYDRQWERLMEGQTAERRIAARFLIEETEQGFRLTFTAQDGTHRSEKFAAEHQPARSDQTASVRDILGKLGDTPYRCTEVETRFSQPWFIPRSLLAEWRRKTIGHSPSDTGHRAMPNDAQRPIDNGQRSMGNGEQLMASDFPRLMTCRFCLRHAWGMCKKEPTHSKTSNSKWPEPLFLALGDGRRFRLEFDCRKCEMYVMAPEEEKTKTG